MILSSVVITAAVIIDGLNKGKNSGDQYNEDIEDTEAVDIDSAEE